MWKLLLPALLFVSSAAASAASAKIRIVTTTPTLAEIVSEIAGQGAEVVSLTRAGQNLHFFEPRSSMAEPLKKADLLVRIGLGFEDGWLPPLMASAKNPKIEPNSPGYFEVGALLKRRPTAPDEKEIILNAHPGGNPHFLLNPKIVLWLAGPIAEKLKSLGVTPREDFARELKARIAGWEPKIKDLAGKPIATYHDTWDYLLVWTRMKRIARIEPEPGIPPGPERIAHLGPELKKEGVEWVFVAPEDPLAVVHQIAHEAGATTVVLPDEVDSTPHTITYFDLIAEIVRRLSALSGVPKGARHSG